MTKLKKIIALDFDNTLIHHKNPFVKLITAIDNALIKEKIAETQTETIAIPRDSWQQADVNNAASAFCSYFLEKDYQVVILTRRPNVKFLKEDAIKKMLKHKINCTEIVFNCKDKTAYGKKIGAAMIVDDSVQTCKNFNKGIPGALTVNFKRNQKAKLLNSNFIRVGNWSYIKDAFEKFEKEHLENNRDQAKSS